MLKAEMELSILERYIRYFILRDLCRKDFGVAIKTEENKDYWLNGYSGTIENMKKGFINPKNYLSDRVFICYTKEDTIHTMTFNEFKAKHN